MENKRNLIIGGIVLIFIILAFVLLQNRNDDIDPGDNVGNEDVSEDIATIDAVHEFDNGTHTVSGSIDVPTPCHTLDHDVTIAESFPEQVTINFTTTDDVEEGEMCAQVVTPVDFEVAFEASENATIRATLNDEEVQLSFNTPEDDEEVVDDDTESEEEPQSNNDDVFMKG